MSNTEVRAVTKPSVLHITTVPASLMFLHGQVGYVQARGWQVHALSSAGPSLSAFASKEQVTVHTADFTRNFAPIEDLSAFVQTIRVIWRVRPAIVHAHTPKAALLGLLAAFLVPGCRRIYHVRGLPFESARGLQRFLLRWTERFTCLLANVVVCQSPSLRRLIRAKRLCSREKCITLAGGIGNGVDADYRFHPDRVICDAVDAVRSQRGIPAAAFVAGYVGRLARDKGLAELLGMWQLVRAKHQGAHLLVVGALDARAPADDAVIASLRNLPNVHFTGRVDEPSTYYAAMSVLVLPTYREGMPNVALEAAAMGLPVVATRTTGCVDAVLDGATGVLVEPRSAEHLAGALDFYIRHPDLRTRHGAAGRTRMLTDFRQLPVWEASHALYESLLPNAERSHAWTGWGKRIFDVIGAGVLLVITAPLLALAAIAVRFTMGPPVLFRQLRAGKHGRPFTLHKFRTMSDMRKADGQLLPAEQRITRLGRWLRSTSLDELPQLWDVLRGRMSLVGPRPLLLEYLPLYNKAQARRHLMRPGVTGWAQVNGRNAISWDEKFALDVWYVDHASLWLDLRVLARTLPKVVTLAGVSPQARVVVEPFRGD